MIYMAPSPDGSPAGRTHSSNLLVFTLDARYAAGPTLDAQYSAGPAWKISAQPSFGHWWRTLPTLVGCRFEMWRVQGRLWRRPALRRPKRHGRLGIGGLAIGVPLRLGGGWFCWRSSHGVVRLAVARLLNYSAP
jgi:hypothetical protein